MQVRLVVFGLGYCGAAVAAQAAAQAGSGPAEGLSVHGVTRQTEPAATRAALDRATHVLSTVPPPDAHADAPGGAAADGAHDPVLARYGAELARAPALRWVGYLLTTGVYGDRGGDWVDEATPPAPRTARAVRRVAAEAEWSRLADRCAVDLFRLGGIYGPGRSAFDELRAGRARRVSKPGHAFGRIHCDDIVQAVLAAIHQPRPAGLRVLHLVDDEPAESAAVIEEAARLLGIPPPPAIPYATALTATSPMARSFWADNRKVSSQATRTALGIAWQHPTYREGLRAILAGEARGQDIAQGGAEQVKVLRA